jgi:predicted anti-sigma-YlaC factor YlaD
MKCNDFEERIYLYAELSEKERKQLETHLQECKNCRELFAFVSTAQRVVAQAANTKPQPIHHGRLTSNIMQAVNQQQSHGFSWLNSQFVRYAMVAASLALIVLFGAEQMKQTGFTKRMPVARAVVLESASISETFLKRKDKSENKPSLYACAKSGACDNMFIKNFVKKSF